MKVEDLIFELQGYEDYKIAFAYCHENDEFFCKDEWEWINDIIVDEIDFENKIVYLG